MPSVAQQGAGTTLRFIPYADLSILDQYMGPYTTRNFGYMIYDTPFGWRFPGRSRKWSIGGR